MSRRPKIKPQPATLVLEPDPDAVLAAYGSERLRRVALGLTVALVTLRAFTTSEPDLKNEAGNGLVWVAAVVVTAGLALASMLVGGRLKLRWSWVDLAVIALCGLVGVSAIAAAEHRTAVNLAWEWAAVGFAYVLLRNLPKTRDESAVVALALVATAVAIAAYGTYQVGVELGDVRAIYLKNPQKALRLLGIAPGSPSQAAFEQRLLHSHEPWSTFALPNSLAGFLVGPLVLLLAVACENLFGREKPEPELARCSSWPALALAVPPTLILLVCLLLTMSRSAWIGLGVGSAVVLWRSRRRVRKRTLALAAAASLGVIGVLVAAGLATGRLDRLVLTQSFKSLRYRWEYWQGTWKLITQRPGVFWQGVGPGNFGWAYVRYKLPQSSEEIQDPHNLVLEVWATAGAGAVVALVSALGLAFANLLGPARTGKNEAIVECPTPLPSAPDAPPRKPGWLVLCAGAGLAGMVFWSLVILFEVDLLMRWLVLGMGWLLAVGCLGLLWKRRPIAASGCGAGALAVTVNLLAAGGIGIPAVALLLWALIALGLNLSDDRPCARLRDVGGRLPTFSLAIVWAALGGLFSGAALTYWRTERDLAEAEAALRAKPPSYGKAHVAYLRAIETDPYSARPFLGEAFADFQAWRERGSLVQDRRWVQIPITLAKAVEPGRNPGEPGRNPFAWTLHRERAVIARELLDILGANLGAKDTLGLKGTVVEASRKAALLYPTNASLRAMLAQASADLGLTGDAVKEAEEALRLSNLTPHLDKKLPGPLRRQLEAQLPAWRKAAEAMPANGVQAP